MAIRRLLLFLYVSSLVEAEPLPNRRLATITNRPTIPRAVIDIERIDLNCPVECACQRGYINCTSRSLHYVPTKNRRTNYTTFLPHAMWLNDNKFNQVIAASNFTDWFMLKTLSLRNCSVKRVAANTFANMPRLAILDLSYNRGGIVLDALAFSGTNLEALLLDDNPGIVFSEKAFENATIRSIRLRRCKLTNLSPDVFLPLSGTVESLVASENDILGLSDRFEGLFTTISFFDVSKNPWVCDCSVEWLVRVFINRLNRTRSLNPVDEWGTASGHGLPVPACVTPSQRAGVAMDTLRLGTSDFACTAASVIGIDVEQLRDKNQTRFRCSAAGDPVATVSWHFPRAEDEYNWALSLVENLTTVISPTAYASSTTPGGIVIVSQTFLTVMNRPAVTVSSNGLAGSNQVRLICRAFNHLGAASLMTNFDVTQRNNQDLQATTTTSKQKLKSTTTTSSAPTAATDFVLKSQDLTVVPTPLTKLLNQPYNNNAETTTAPSSNTNIVPIGYDYSSSNNNNRLRQSPSSNNYEPLYISAVGEVQQQMAAGGLKVDYAAAVVDDASDDNATTTVMTKWQDGENVGMNQQSIPQGILVTVAVLIAIVMSSLGGCCLVIACSTSKVPNCPNIKRAPSRCRDNNLFVSPSTVVLAQQTANAGNETANLAMKPLLKSNRQQQETLPRSPKLAENNENSAKSPPRQPRPFSPHSNHHRTIYSPPQTFSTFRAATALPPHTKSKAADDAELARPILLSAFPRTVIRSPSKRLQNSDQTEPSRDDSYYEARPDTKRRYNSYYGKHRNGIGLNLFLSPPPPPPPVLDGIVLDDLGVEINRNASNSFPGDMAKPHPHHHHHPKRDRFMSNSQSDLCTCSPDFNNEKKTSSGYRSMLLNGACGTSDESGASHDHDEEVDDDNDASAATTSGVRSTSEPGDGSGSGAVPHPVACFNPGNDIVRKTCVPVAAEEITFI